MSQGFFPTASSSVPWKPQNLPAKEVAPEEQEKWETVKEKLKVKDVEFEEN